MTLLLALSGCALDAQPEQPADTSERMGSDHQAERAIHGQDNEELLPPTGLHPNCSGGWCQDYYTKKWCTNYTETTAGGWDHTGCTWSGWNSSNEFCGTNSPGYATGWEWGQGHTHCN